MRKFAVALTGLLGAACGDSFTSDPFAVHGLEAPDSGAQAAGTGGLWGGGSAGGSGQAGEAPEGGSAGSSGAPSDDGGSGEGGSPAADGGTCPQSEKSCGGECVDRGPEHGCDNPSCDPCPEAPNGDPFCSLGRCATECHSGYEWDGTGCAPGPVCADGLKICDGIPSLSSLCVGPSPTFGCALDNCDPCPEVTNGTVACNGEDCEITCDVGYLLEDGQCVPTP